MPRLQSQGTAWKKMKFFLSIKLFNELNLYEIVVLLGQVVMVMIGNRKYQVTIVALFTESVSKGLKGWLK